MIRGIAMQEKYKNGFIVLLSGKSGNLQKACPLEETSSRLKNQSNLLTL
jgi:hypothetical protein